MKPLIVLLSLCFAAPMCAEEWLDFSAREQARGGTGNLARGGLSAYYNPANASRRPWEGSELFHIEFDIPAAFSAGIHGKTMRFIFDTVDLANDLANRFEAGAFDTSNSAIDFEDFQFALRVFDALDQLTSLNGDGLYVGTALGLGVRWSGLGLLPRDSFALSVGGFGIGAATPIVDLDSLRNFRLTDESGAQFEAIVAAAIVNSNQAQTPQTVAGQNFSQQLQAGGYSAVTADALARQSELAGINFDGTVSSILLDFLLNTLNGTGQSLESGANPLSGNRSGVLIRGLSWYEVGLTYSFGMPLMGASDWLTLGATVKFIQAYVYSELLLVENMDKNGVNDALRRMAEKAGDAYQLKGDASRFNVGIDLGVIFTPQVIGLNGLAISLSARNINGPEFRWDGAVDGEPSLVRFDPQVRLGASYTLFHGINLPLSVALEADLNPIGSDILPNYNTQFVRAGVSFEPSLGIFGFGARAGLMKNVADADQAVTFTAGLGFQVSVVRLDVGGQLGLSNVDFGSTTDFETLPQRFGASVQLAIDLKF